MDEVDAGTPADVMAEGYIQRRGPQLAMAAITVMAATLLSRVFGLAREQVMAGFFGAQMQIDAYRVAFILPNLFRMLLADAAIGAAFIPVFTSYLAKDEREEAWRVGSTIINLMVLGLCFFLGLGMIFAPQLIKVLAPGFVGKVQTFQLTLLLTRIMFPAVLFMALSGLVMGILNSYDHFAAPAVSPVLWNIMIIGSIVLLASRLGVVSLALGITLGSLVQFVFQLPFLGGRGARYSFTLDWRHPGVKQVGLLLLPVMLTLGTTDINTIVDTRFASTLVTGSVATLGYAVRLWHLPLGLFAIAISTVLFPTFSRQVAREDIQGFKETLSVGIRSIFLIMAPAAVGLMVLSVPIVRLIFEHGKFSARDTLLTASPLFYYSVGLMAAGGLHLVNRAFYSLKDSVTPMMVAGLAIVVNYFGDWFLMLYLPVFARLVGISAVFPWFGYAHGGIALSTSVVCFFNFLILLEILRRRLKGVDGRRMFVSFAKISLASVALGFAAFYGWKLTAFVFGPSVGGQILSLGVGISLGLLAYLCMAFLLGVEEIKTVRELMLVRLREKR